jgi:transcriptional regulator with XRE-family HTH domain
MINLMMDHQMDDCDIPQALAYIQKQNAWTQREMAIKLGIQPSHYNEILKGKRMLPFKAACEAYALGVPASVLLQVNNRRTDQA